MPRKGKITADEKVRIVEAYLSVRIGCNEAERLAGVAHNSIAQWTSRYKSKGPTGLLPKRHNQKYSKEMKLSAVMDYLAGKGFRQEICQKYKIQSTKPLKDWLKMYNRHEGFTIQTGGSCMTRGRDTTAEERIEIVKACITNGSPFQVELRSTGHTYYAVIKMYMQLDSRNI